jgi:hypothetical protein
MGGEYIYLNQERKQMDVKKYRKIIKSVFWVYSKKRKEVRKSKEDKTLTK